MNENFTAETIRNLLAPLLDKGFTFLYTYEKGGDSSCVYIGRFQKGGDFFDWREISGSDQINLVAYVRGRYTFPTLKYLYKKEMRRFSWRHIFKRATMAEKREFYASLILKELEKLDFFGIPL